MKLLGIARWIGICTLWLGLAAHGQDGQRAAAAPGGGPTPGVTVVLAGGGAKGFAHLAVLRRLEQDQIRIAKIVGTSMGAVIGGLYASGLSTQEIERIIASTEPGRVALDQIARTDLPHRTRAYQQQYPVDVELGIKDGQLTFARGVSDGQRLLTLLQQLTAHVPPQSRFDDLRVPFRAVATRFRDGELVSFDHGTLALTIRASMAAPGVFAPVEIEGETYVDGGLVANLPVEVALREGADIIVASYLGDTDRPGDTEAGNALNVANQMLTILMRQNERRNIALLRPQDILVQPALQGFGFGSFDKAADIVAVGEKAVAALDDRFQALAAQVARRQEATPAQPSAFSQREIYLHRIGVHGNHKVPDSYVQNALAGLLGHEYDAREVAQAVDELYTTGHFERISYHVLQIRDSQYELLVDVNEKTYGPNYLKANLGFFSESGGTNLFSAGLGYRNPWITPSGLELDVDVRGGSQSELALSLYQPLGTGWGIAPHVSYNGMALPLYRPGVDWAQKMGQATLSRTELGVDLSYDFNKKFTTKLGVLANQTQVRVDSPRSVGFANANGSTTQYELQDGQWEFGGGSAQFTADLLDSASFPTKGYYVKLQAIQGWSSNPYTSTRLSALWALSRGAHVLNLGLDLGSDRMFDCETCSNTTSRGPLYLGGFQSMGAYQLGQLSGDRLAHLQSTYMYRLSEGGILLQPTFVGVVLEAGDAWLHTDTPHTKYSATGFIAVDSKLGDVFFGVASGSNGNRNMFLQLGRRFSLW